MSAPAHTDDPHRRRTAIGDVASCRAEDFDGHTTFAMLSAEQRLEWADRAARLFIALHGQASPPGRPTSCVTASRKTP
jgi:hypothetical protein